MKIIQINFKNIQSLKGEHSISFVEGALATTGLYAITGPTGAGKSTILDVITLALYNKTCRHEKFVAEEIITKNTFDAFSEVIFEVNNVYYKAKWASSFNKKGIVNASIREISVKKNNLFVLLPDLKTATATNSKIVEIIGLTFEQFTKSVLLAQNNFSAFLEAKPNERADMLSKITGTEIYEQVSRLVFEKHHQINKNYNDLKIEYTELSKTTLSKEEIEEKENQEKEINESIVRIQSQINKIEIDLKNITECNTATANVEKYKNKLANLEALQLANQENYRLLANYNKALPLQGLLKELENEGNKLQEAISNHAQLDISIQELKSKQSSETKELSRKTEWLEEINTELSIKSPIIEKVKLVLNENKRNLDVLTTEKTEFDNLKTSSEKLNSQIVKLNNDIAELENKKSANEIDVSVLKLYEPWKENKEVFSKTYNEIKNDADKIKSNLDKMPILNKEIIKWNDLNSSKNNDLLNKIKNSEDLEVIYTSLLEKTEKLGSIQTLLVEKENCHKKIITFQNLNGKSKSKLVLQNSCQTLEDEIKIQNTTINEFKKSITDKSKIVELLKEKHELSLQIANLETYRANLKKEDECPLCGSKEHPFVLHSPVLQTNEYKTAENELKVIQNQLQEIELKLVKNSSNLTNEKNKLAEIENTLNELLLALQLQELPSENEIVQFEKDLTLQAADLQELIKQIEIVSTEKEINRKKTDFINNEIQQLKKEIAHNDTQIQLKNQELKQIESTIQELEINTKTNFAELQSIVKQFGIVIDSCILADYKTLGITIHEKFTQYTKTINDLSEITSLLNNLLPQKAVVSTTIERCIADYNAKEIAIAKLETEIKNNNEEIDHSSLSFSIKNPVEEEKRLIDTKINIAEEIKKIDNKITATSTQLNEANKQFLKYTADIESFQSSVTKLQETLSTELALSDFKNIDELKKALHLPKAKEIEKQKNDYSSEQNVLIEQIKTIEILLIDLKEKTKFSEPEQQLIDTKEQYTQYISTKNREIGVLMEVIKNAKEKIDKFIQKTAEINEHAELLRKWTHLNSLVGSKEGDKFKKFAQDLTLSLLVQYANRHLNLMIERYELFKDDESLEMELNIIDRQDFDKRRSINSLSGGELFLVSLALAFGLSDLASKNTKIQSLFIDEGFGTLDSEALNNDALEKVRGYSEQQIGVISHVDELKRRITTQIKVVKVNKQHSVIELTNEFN